MMQIFSGASSGAWFEKAQRFGKSFMLPIAVLPAAGLLLGIGGALSNPNTLTAYPFLNVDWLQAIFTIMTSAGSIVFANCRYSLRSASPWGWRNRIKALPGLRHC